MTEKHRAGEGKVFISALCFVLYFFFLQAAFSTSLFAQTWTMPVDGKVFAGGDKLSGAIVTLFKNGQQQQQVVTTSNGRFSFELPPNAVYIISITKPGYITKKFKINTENVPADRSEQGGFNLFEPDVTLFEMPTSPEISKRIEAILSQPIAVYQYIPAEANFGYDEKYTEAIQAKLAELAQLQKQVEKEMGDKAKNAALEAQKQLEIDKKYKAAIAKGDAGIAAKDFSAAKNGYTEALGIKPGEAYPKSKLAELDKLMADSGKQKELDAKYQAAISKGDGSFRSKDYAAAKAAFTEASGIKPSEAYPKTKLAEIEGLLADAGKQKELDAKYQAAIAKGDGAFGSKDYPSAKTAFIEASGIKPGEGYPKTKIAEIDKLLADAGKQKELDAKYQAAIAKGDNAFNSKDYTAAKAGYTEASGIKPSEAYPKTRLAEIDKLMADAGKQKELDSKYQAAILKGDGAFASKDYPSAKTAYTDASGIKPGETYPKTKLAEIDKLLAEAGKQKELDAKYQAAITKGDGLFSSKDYAAARSAYSEASGIKPAEAYPKTKIAEIDKLLGAAEAEKQKELQYKNAIAKGDAAFASKDYAGAKSSYTEALGVKLAEAYPKTKIAEIDKIFAELAKAGDLEKQYKDLISKADNSFTQKDYTSARSSYSNASSLKSAEQYPKTKIAEIDKLMAEGNKQKELDAKYQVAIAKADASFASKDYTGARGGYTEASAVKPAEAYPKTKIAEIDKLLVDLSKQKSAGEKEQQYKDAIAKADKLFGTKDYSNSKSAYIEALAVKPAEQYPKTRIAEIDKLLAESGKQNELNTRYQTAIEKGDNGFNGKDYATAKAGYNEALAVKPSEAYPKSRLAEIEKLLSAANNASAESEVDAKYKATIAKGDKAFAVKDYVTAKPMYTEALRIKPAEQYPKDKLAEIATIEKNLASASEQKETDQQYIQAIARADKSFSQKDYNSAKLGYEDALTYKPNEKYPQDRIKLIKDIMQKQLAAMQNVKKEPKKSVSAAPVVSEADKAKVYQDELRAKYPNGVTEEEYINNGKTILRRVVIKDDFAGVYTKVTHNWGGVYCFRDNTPITEIMFENESR